VHKKKNEIQKEVLIFLFFGAVIATIWMSRDRAIRFFAPLAQTASIPQPLNGRISNMH
jgi:adenylosuccinate lyase